MREIEERQAHAVAYRHVHVDGLFYDAVGSNTHHRHIHNLFIELGCRFQVLGKHRYVVHTLGGAVFAAPRDQLSESFSHGICRAVRRGHFGSS